MDIENLKLRQEFNSWFEKNHADLFAENDFSFYGKSDIEKRAYYLEFLEYKGLVVTIDVNEKMANKFFAKFYNKKSGHTVVSPKNCADSAGAWQDGISRCFTALIIEFSK